MGVRSAAAVGACSVNNGGAQRWLQHVIAGGCVESFQKGSQVATAIFELVVGIFFAFAGGELFLRGVLGIAAWLRIPKAIAAATLAAFATSSPEVSVAVASAWQGSPQIALGDALGSNVVNVALILGLVLWLGPLPFDWLAVQRDYRYALVAPLLIGLIALDGHFAVWEGLGLLCVFASWLVLTYRAARDQRESSSTAAEHPHPWLASLLSLVGLGFLILAGNWIVSGGSEVGRWLGMSPYLIGATMVALGTSAPELATAVIAKLRGHDEVGVGTVLGSNIFNSLLIVGLACSISPFQQSTGSIVASLLFGLLSVLALWPDRHQRLGRWRGLLLLGLYVLSILAAWYTQGDGGGIHG